MKRLAVAGALVCLTTASLGVGAIAPAGAAAPGTTTVYAANAFSFAGGHPFGGTFCVNGTAITSATETEQVSGPFTADSGEANVLFYDEDNITCDTPDPTAQATVDLPDGGTVTLMAFWGADGQAVVMLVDPLECVASGSARLVVRNGTDIGGSGAVDVYATPPGGDDTLQISGVASGDQGSVDLPAGTYTDVFAARAGTQTSVADIGTSVALAANTVTYAYLYGGNDGDPGSFLVTQPLTACAVATTTTTAPPAAAQAVAATPAFTG
jgi:hypothetical protein